MKKLVLIGVAASLLFSCANKVEKVVEAEVETNTSVSFLEGDYVTEGYAERAEGYDWSVVSIEAETDSTAHISIRSRVDIKKASCTFDAQAELAGIDTLKSVYEDKTILFVINGDTLSILTEKEEDNAILNYFCSGGASLLGNYAKIKEELDTIQLVEVKEAE